MSNDGGNNYLWQLLFFSPLQAIWLRPFLGQLSKVHHRIGSWFESPQYPLHLFYSTNCAYIETTVTKYTSQDTISNG